jgi:2'-5' RNA ligase
VTPPVSGPHPEPLVLTLRLEEEAQRRFDAQRTALFPPGRTQVGAHVTLFHAVPAEHRATVLRDVQVASRVTPFLVRVTGLMSLGRGVAYRLESDVLAALHRQLQERWSPWLTRQDSQPFRPHVTVQNKVEPELARATCERLSAGFAPYDVTATGLELWRYRGGPWEAICAVPFEPAGGPPSALG